MGCDSSKDATAPANKTGGSADKTGGGGQRNNNNNNNNGGAGGTSSAGGTADNRWTGGANNASTGGRQGGDQSRWPVCHFCHKRIPEKEYNAHTVMCDEREVTCWNSWCRQIVRQGDLQKHLEECGKKQKAMCPKCGSEILAIEMQAHREMCQPKRCPHCNDLCIIRIHKWCPKVLLSKIIMKNGPFATQALKAKYLPGAKAKDPVAVANYNVARIQLLWRWLKCKALIEETIFRVVYKEMDLKKEGFAIFKAQDKVNDSHVLAPKRSRSVLQAPVVAPATSSHYFPCSSSMPITLEHVARMISDIKSNILLPYPAAWRVFTESMNHLNTMPNVVRISPPVGARMEGGRMTQGCKIVVVGDLHGQTADLLHILEDCGMPSESNYYVFNGDFVDRGACGVEILLILFSLMLSCPKYVTLNRGNHECDYMNDEYGFDVEVSTKYDRNVFRLIQRCFCALPLATIIGNRIFVVHGGLPRRKGVTIEDIIRIQRFRQIPMPEYQQPEEDEIFQDMLWSDPVEDIKGWRESQRGAGVEFGSDVTEEFLKNNKLDLVIRSHEECLSGFEEHHNGKLITIFSASNYDGPDTNYGAVCTFIGDNVDPSFNTYQMYEAEYEDPQVVNMGDSFALATPTAARINSFAGAGAAATAAAAVSGCGSGTSSPTANVGKQLSRRRTKDDILRELRERIFQRRHRLMAYFSKLDRTNKGTLWLIEWVESMRNVLNLDVPWYFIRGYLAEIDSAARIRYSTFLCHYHNILQELWIDDWKYSVCARLLQQQRANHRSQMVTAAFSKEIVNYNEYCSFLRTVDYTISDCQLFQLFQFFDANGLGYISGPDFMKRVPLIANGKPDPLRWDIDAMEQLQNIVIQGRTQLPSLFKVSMKDKILTRDRFMSGMAQIGRGMRKQLTQAQKDKIYEFMLQRSPPGEEMTFDIFLLCMYVFDSRKISSTFTSHSIAELAELGLAPYFMKSSPMAK